MSAFAGTGGGELENVIRQIVEAYLNGILISSAGGDSPKINRVTSFGEVSGFADILDSVVKQAVAANMEENGLLQTETGKISASEKGLEPSGALSAVQTGVGGVKDPLGIVTKILPVARLIPIIGAILATAAMAKQIRDLLLAPGGPFDIRFRRDIQNEVLSTFDREEKASIRQGLTIIRITSSKTLRGEQGIGQTGQVGITGIARYDNDFEAFQKGVVP